MPVPDFGEIQSAADFFHNTGNRRGARASDRKVIRVGTDLSEFRNREVSISDDGLRPVVFQPDGVERQSETVVAVDGQVVGLAHPHVSQTVRLVGSRGLGANEDCCRAVARNLNGGSPPGSESGFIAG